MTSAKMRLLLPGPVKNCIAKSRPFVRPLYAANASAAIERGSRTGFAIREMGFA